MTSDFQADPFRISLELFDGPIDLLLHLVKKHELPIERVSLSEVCSQYLECLESMRSFDLEIAGEYLVVAATLLSIKSSVLLNEPVELIEDEDGNLVDPHEELLRRLREAEIYRDGAQRLAGRPYLGIDVFQPPSRLGKIPAPPESFRDHDAFLLGRAFQKLLKEAGMSQNYLVSVDNFPVVEEMMRVLDLLRVRSGGVSFRGLVQDARNRVAIVATFLALLELGKRCIIEVLQDDPDGDIVIGLRRGVESQGDLSFSSEFDLIEGKVLVNA